MSARNNRVIPRIAVAIGALLCTGAAPAKPTVPHKVGLGNVLATKDGGQIYGFDIDQNGIDGVLASAGYGGNDFFVSV